MMKDNTENYDALNEEVDLILEQARALREQDDIEKNAQKYKKKHDMEEIFSNTSKNVRLEKQTPMEAEENEKNFKDSKNQVTADAQKILDADELNDDMQKTQVVQTPKLIKNKQSEKDESDAEDKKITVVSLKPEYDENTYVSDEVIEDVEQFNVNKIHVTNIDTIDIDSSLLDSDGENKQKDSNTQLNNAEKINSKNEQNADTDTKTPRQKEKKSRFEQLFGKPQIDPASVNKVVSKVPAYSCDKNVKSVSVKAGKFTDIVRDEYEEYLKSPDPSISKSYKPLVDSKGNIIKHKNDTNRDSENKRSSRKDAAVKNGSSKNKRIDDNSAEEVPLLNSDDDFSEKGFLQKFMELFSPNKAKSVEEAVVTVDDYQSTDDEKSVMDETNSNIKKLFFKSFLMGILTLVTLVITILQSAFPQMLQSAIPNVEYIFCICNILTTALSCIICAVTIKNGLAPLARFRGNSDTALAVAAIAVSLQTFVSPIRAKEFFDGTQSLYSVVLLIAFLLNTIGKLVMVLRVKNNFRFIIAKTPAYAGKIYTNETDAAKMMSGTSSNKPFIAYQHKTSFLSNFLKISYAPDPSEEMAGRIAPFTVVCSLFVAIAYAIIHKTFTGAVSSLAVTMMISVPLCSLLAINIPMYKMCKKNLKNNAMVAGYLSVKQFCDSTALMVDATEIYPKGSIVLDGVKPYVKTNIDSAILAAAEMMKQAGCPMGMVFEELREENLYRVPKIESVMYEEKLGLVGWTGSQRILVGKRELLEKYGINVPDEEYEKHYLDKGKQVTFLAQSGELLAMFITTYKASLKVAREFQRSERNGVSILIRTTDCNITGDLIADSFGVFYRTIKVLPTGLGNVCKEASEKKEETSRAYLATRGRFVSLSGAVNSCIKMKSNISLAVVIQFVAVILGVLLVATMALYASVRPLGTVEILLYLAFWTAASIIVPLIHRP